MSPNEETESTFESRNELSIGQRLPPPFAHLQINVFLRRTDSGGWLYSVSFIPPEGGQE